MSLLTLPCPLVLFIHLHLLHFSPKEGPGYDERLFDPKTRGIRERMTAMEDVSYFLVAKIEGSIASAKKVRKQQPVI